ncbi:outer membrane protein [Sphingomonas sp. DT-51]|uniref:outer membrane protein n=1 Tax=Sphingomonas sp. DT-51 TaxID=3396165 RepID=UPI003F19CF29
MKRFLVVPALASIALAGAAQAQDFSGPSVGVQLGWNEETIRNPRTELGTVAIDQKRDSFVGGVFAGYDQQILPNVVLGVQGDINIAASDELRQRNAASNVNLDPKYSFDLTARAGYVVAPGTLLYVRGGYANERVRTTVAAASSTTTDASNRDGWTVGGGVERVLYDKISARVEYRYADLKDDGGKFDRHRIMVGAAYRF